MIYLKLILTMLFWGGTFIAARYVSYHTTPFVAAFIRFLIASVGFLIVLKFSRQNSPKLSLKTWFLLVLLGMTGVFSYNFFFFKGLYYVEAGRAAVIIATNPIFISILAALFFKEKLDAIKISGTLLSVFGAIIIITRGEIDSLWTKGIGYGELLIIGCVFSWVIYSILGKVAMHDISPLIAVGYSTIIGTFALFFTALGDGLWHEMTKLNLLDWIGLAYLGVFGTVLGFLWFYEGIHQIGAGRAAVFINLVPISAVVLSYFLMDEVLTFSIILGTLLVLMGVSITNRSDWILKYWNNSKK